MSRRNQQAHEHSLYHGSGSIPEVHDQGGFGQRWQNPPLTQRVSLQRYPQGQPFILDDQPQYGTISHKNLMTRAPYCSSTGFTTPPQGNLGSNLRSMCPTADSKSHVSFNPISQPFTQAPPSSSVLHYGINTSLETTKLDAAHCNVSYSAAVPSLSTNVRPSTSFSSGRAPYTDVSPTTTNLPPTHIPPPPPVPSFAIPGNETHFPQNFPMHHLTSASRNLEDAHSVSRATHANVEESDSVSNQCAILSHPDAGHRENVSQQLHHFGANYVQEEKMFLQLANRRNVSCFGSQSHAPVMQHTEISNLIPPSSFPSVFRDQEQAMISRKRDQNTSDQLFVNDWLARHGKHVETDRKKSVRKMKLWEIKENLRECLLLLNKLEKLHKELEKSCEILDPVEWKESVSAAENQKALLISRISEIKMNADLSDLKCIMKCRRKKRNRGKRKKEEMKQQKLANKKQRMKLHQQIDSWMEGIQDKLDQEKRQEILKKEADSVLGAVTRRRTEANRFILLLTSLQKLRQVRTQSAGRKGVPLSSASDNTFEQVIEGLSYLWEKRLKNYKAEEQVLQVMLEEEEEERNKNEKQKKKTKLFETWERVLFGEESVSSKVFPFYQMFTEATRTMEAFLDVRNSWDKFLVSSDTVMASGIPVGWVIPAPPSSDQWKKFCLQNSNDGV